MSTSLDAIKLEKLQVKNANTEKDNNNGDKQPLTIEVRNKTLAEKRQKIWVGTMARAITIGSLSYGGFTKVGLSIVQ